MQDVESKYLDAYKQLDVYLMQTRGGDRGVSAYIEKMEDLSENESALVVSWQKDLRELKRLRHIRTVIAHETGNSGCREEDLESLSDFHERFLLNLDPFSLLTKAKDRAYEKATGASAGASVEARPALTPSGAAKKNAQRQKMPREARPDSEVQPKKDSSPAVISSNGAKSEDPQTSGASGGQPQPQRKKQSAGKGYDGPLLNRPSRSPQTNEEDDGGGSDHGIKKTEKTGNGSAARQAKAKKEKKKRSWKFTLIFWLIFAAVIVALAIVLEKLSEGL